MVRHFRVAAVCIALLPLAVSGCGKDSPTPTTPSTPAAPTLRSVTITGLDAIRTGFFSDYTATATLSDGTTQTVTASATWTSSNTGLATVEASGWLTGRGHGSVVLSASYQGQTATKTVGVVNNYGGTWNGSYIVRVCDADGAFATARWCRDQDAIGTTYSLTLTHSLAGNDRSQISGSLTNGIILDAAVTGTVTGDGRLNISSDTPATGPGITFLFQLGGWDTRLVGSSQMTGRTAINLLAINTTGNAYEEHDITTATLTNPQFTPVAEP